MADALLRCWASPSSLVAQHVCLDQSHPAEQRGRRVDLTDIVEYVWHDPLAFMRYGIRIPMRDGVPLGATEFSNMHAAYDLLPQPLKDRLAGMTITHDFNKFWEKMRRERGSTRPPLTEAQRKAKPPVSQPVFLTRPITPRTVLMWDNMGTIHNAVADYRPDEPRLIKRCQVAATRFFPVVRPQ